MVLGRTPEAPVVRKERKRITTKALWITTYQTSIVTAHWSKKEEKASKDHKLTSKTLVKNTGKGSAYFEPGANNLRSGLLKQTNLECLI